MSLLDVRCETQRTSLGLRKTSYTLFGSDWKEYDHESSLLTKDEMETARKVLEALYVFFSFVDVNNVNYTQFTHPITIE